MLVNLTPINSFRTEMEIYIKNSNRDFSGCTIKEKKKWGYEKHHKIPFYDIFIPSEYTGIYYSEFNENTINSWCKQNAVYGNRKTFIKIKELYKDDIRKIISFEKNAWTYGVADSLEQIKEFYEKNEDGYFQGNHVVSCFEVVRNPEAHYCGWRWHKWGPYIGTKNPQCEYLNDEPEIDKVICFSIYKVV